MAAHASDSLLQFSTHTDGSWNLERIGGAYPAWTDARPGVAVGGILRPSVFYATGAGKRSASPAVRIAGLIRKPARIDWLDPTGAVSISMEFVIAEEHPLFFFRLVVGNTGDHALALERIMLMELGGQGRLRLHPSQHNVTFFCNGWQSWSFAGALRPTDWMPGSKLGPVNAPMHESGSACVGFGRGKFRSDMFTVLTDKECESCAVIGFLSQREQFGGITAEMDSRGPRNLRLECAADGVRVDPGGVVRTDWACLIPASTKEPALDWYLESAARECGARVPDRAPAGWCSWYQYSEKVTESDVRANVQQAADMKNELPLDLIQLDDGYEANVGDWLERNEKFPAPMKELAVSICRRGFLPGIWLAPFVAKPDSRLVREHPSWLLKTERGNYTGAGLLWLRGSRVLDVTHPEAMAYIEKVIHAVVHEWGFRFLKLDFLYAAAVVGQKRHPRQTRAQVLQAALEKIRAAAGKNAFLLGCGCPLGSGIGIFDAMRIGPDVSRRWAPHLFGRRWLVRRDPTVPSAYNSARNILTRAPLHRRWWWNDPDCFLARDSGTFLNDPERRTLATAIAVTGGMLLFSDNLTALSPESRHMAQTLLPPLSQRAAIPDWSENLPPQLAVQHLSGPLGAWQVAGVFNWTGRAAETELSLTECGLSQDSLVYSFWEKKALNVRRGRVDLRIPRHGCALLGLRVPGKGACYVGSSLHISQGMEIAEWKAQTRSVSLTIYLPRKYEGEILLRLPKPPMRAAWNRRNAPVQVLTGSLYSFRVSGEGMGRLVIRW